MLSLARRFVVPRQMRRYPRQAFVPSWFDPTRISGLLAWYDASDVSTITADGSGFVSQWSDKSGNGHHLTQSTAANKPAWGPNAGARQRTINGIDVLDFDGSASPNHEYVASAAFTQAQPITVFAVVQSDITTGANVQFIGNDNQTPTLYYSDVSGTRRWSYFAGSAVNSATAVDTNLHRFSAIFNGASSALYLDGTSISTGNPGTQGFSSKRIVVGADPFNGFAWDGGIGEVIYYAAALSTADRVLVQTYLSGHWT